MFSFLIQCCDIYSYIANTYLYIERYDLSAEIFIEAVCFLLSLEFVCYSTVCRVLDSLRSVSFKDFHGCTSVTNVIN
jgi:hypothetical protein